MQEQTQLSLHDAKCRSAIPGYQASLWGELTFEKRRLFRKCSGGKVHSVPTVTLAGALVGRDSELAMLAGLVTEVAAGRGSAVLIEGEPGIGKSALVRTALAG